MQSNVDANVCLQLMLYPLTCAKLNLHITFGYPIINSVYKKLTRI